ncbi:MAG: T9SS type A sorting domain-containing protein [Bacteroidetes bacterium]|nr:T9SS type A sorting domain-containing protein [Bacteroidota bacterium]
MKKKLLSFCTLFCFVNFIHSQNWANARLDINGVSALVNSNGDLFWDYASAQYTVPKGGTANTIFAGALWIGGLDTSGQLHLAAQTYRQSGNDFYPGPVMNSVSYSAATDAQWNKVWKINKTAVDSFCTWWVNHSVYPGYTIPSSILNWPGNGNVALGEAAQLAPYVDGNNDGIYDPNFGDYPCIKGDQAVFMIFNDDRNAHGETGGQKMKIEVHAMAYSFIAPGSYLDSVVFLNYKIYNRSSNDYVKSYIGSWMDFDIGAYDDDYIGCDVTGNMFYGYNGDANDGTSAVPTTGTYGANPPAQGVVFLRGPLATPNDGIDNNRNGVTDEAGEVCMMNHFNYYNNDFSAIGNPVTAWDYFKYMDGFWKDSTHVTYGGNGYGGTTNCDFMFPYNSDPLGWGTNFVPEPTWDEGTVGNTPFDRRGMASSGPFDFYSGEELCVDFALVYARHDTSISWIPRSVTAISGYADSVAAFYQTTSPCTCVPNPLGIKNVSEENSIGVYPNPSNGNFTISWKPKTAAAKLEVYDVSGKVVLVQTINRSTTELNIENFSSGIYFLRIEDGATVAATKLIKE